MDAVFGSFAVCQLHCLCTTTNLSLPVDLVAGVFSKANWLRKKVNLDLGLSSFLVCHCNLKLASFCKIKV